MNANELADKLEDDYWDSRANKVMLESAKMLIQQQDRIGVLEANHKIQLDINEKALQYISDLEKGLESSINLNKAQAERNTDNEPVAWMTAQGIQDVCTVNEKEEMGNDFDDYIIPLYTHPSEHDLGVAEAIGFDKGYKAASTQFDTQLHPAKTLTEDTECQYCKQGCIRCDARKLLTDEEIMELWYPLDLHDEAWVDDAVLRDFARAILKKASEK